MIDSLKPLIIYLFDNAVVSFMDGPHFNTFIKVSQKPKIAWLDMILF